jgi:outer membrane protein assembly factor BamB
MKPSALPLAFGWSLALGLSLLGTAAQSQPTGQSWPAFRGRAAAGVLDGQALPTEWNDPAGTHVLWKTAIPGLAHSSPIVWGERVFVTTAVNPKGEGEFKPGLYGDGTTAEDRVADHQFKLYALDAATGKVVWERTAFEGKPRAGRHIKSTYANPSPATDGEVLVAFFCSEGLYAYDLDGKLLWQKDLGIVVTAAYNVPGYEWGCASSPLLWQGKVFVQVDTTEADFLVALDAKTGAELWRQTRDEWPSWATPNIFEGPAGAELVTNAPKRIRGYDPATGKELWQLGPSSDITAPTPIFTSDLILVASGRRPVKPIYAIRPGSRGDLSPAEGQSTSAGVAWSKLGRGSYMPTPIVYQGRLYVLTNDGIFSCFDVATGDEVYQARVPHKGGGFSASPVAADGKLYLAGEDGEVFVVAAGPKFELLATNPMGEVLMATPALAGGRLFLRGRHHLFAVGQAQAPSAAETKAGSTRQSSTLGREPETSTSARTSRSRPR